jgi:hypothetical protein
MHSGNLKGRATVQNNTAMDNEDLAVYAGLN